MLSTFTKAVTGTIFPVRYENVHSCNFQNLSLRNFDFVFVAKRIFFGTRVRSGMWIWIEINWKKITVAVSANKGRDRRKVLREFFAFLRVG